MRQKRRGDDICTKSGVDNLSDGKKKFRGEGETKEVLNETLEKVSGSKGVRRRAVERGRRGVQCCGERRDCIFFQRSRLSEFFVFQFPPLIQGDQHARVYSDIDFKWHLDFSLVSSYSIHFRSSIS